MPEAIEKHKIILKFSDLTPESFCENNLEI